jgi:hypothetical protein
LEDKVTVQVPVPLHPPPDQPVKLEVVLGVAVSTTLCPSLKFAEAVVHEVPQLRPEGELVTEPLPVPDLFTVKLRTTTETVTTAALAPEPSLPVQF